MILKPDFIIPFGVNKGHMVADIYQYLPTYIEWLIDFVPEFEIDIKNFEKLPNPTIHNKVEIRTKKALKYQLNFALHTKDQLT